MSEVGYPKPVVCVDGGYFSLLKTLFFVVCDLDSYVFREVALLVDETIVTPLLLPRINKQPTFLQQEEAQ